MKRRGIGRAGKEEVPQVCGRQDVTRGKGSEDYLRIKPTGDEQGVPSESTPQLGISSGETRHVGGDPKGDCTGTRGP